MRPNQQFDRHQSRDQRVIWNVVYRLIERVSKTFQLFIGQWEAQMISQVFIECLHIDELGPSYRTQFIAIDRYIPLVKIDMAVLREIDQGTSTLGKKVILQALAAWTPKNDFLRGWHLRQEMKGKLPYIQIGIQIDVGEHSHNVILLIEVRFRPDWHAAREQVVAMLRDFRSPEAAARSREYQDRWPDLLVHNFEVYEGELDVVLETVEHVLSQPDPKYYILDWSAP